MILFPDDIQAMNELLASRSRLDPELLKACQEHIEHEQYADAVFKAFRVLEARLKQRSGVQGESAGKMLNQALQPDGPLTKKLGFNPQQAANYKDLLVGAFAVFRNPEAHAVEAIFQYGSAECQAVLAFVNLMLSVLNRKDETPMDVALKQISRDIGPEATERLSRFVKRMPGLHLKIVQNKASFSFRASFWRSPGMGTARKKAHATIFYLTPEPRNPRLYFPTVHWRQLAMFAHEIYAERLRALGCAPKPGEEDLRLNLQTYNSTAVFDQVYAIVRDVVQAIEATADTDQVRGQ